MDAFENELGPDNWLASDVNATPRTFDPVDVGFRR